VGLAGRSLAESRESAASVKNNSYDSLEAFLGELQGEEARQERISAS
jgi:hypothetical protein